MGQDPPPLVVTFRPPKTESHKPDTKVELKPPDKAPEAQRSGSATAPPASVTTTPASATAAPRPNSVTSVPTMAAGLAFPAETLRSELYELALELSARVFTVVELAEVERYHLRDQLDRQSTSIPLLVARGMSTTDMKGRRELYKTALRTLTECTAVIDILGQRGTVEPEALEAARSVALRLSEKLAEVCERTWGV